jgi:hypothetical protein
VIDLVTALAEKPPASAGYRGSNLMHWRTGVIQARLRLDWQMGVQTCWPLFLGMLAGKWRRRTGFERNIVNYLRLARRIDAARKPLQ